MSVKNIQELYVQELKDLYSAETQLVEALPKVAKAASSPKLAKAVEGHLQQTKEHVSRLEEIFADFDDKPSGHKCKAMEGLIKEVDGIIGEVKEGPLRDCALIIAAQKVEHYEIAGYGSARALAELVGTERHAEILQTTLDEEYETNLDLTDLAEGEINKQAVAQHKETASANR